MSVAAFDAAVISTGFAVVHQGRALYHGQRVCKTPRDRALWIRSVLAFLVTHGLPRPTVTVFEGQYEGKEAFRLAFAAGRYAEQAALCGLPEPSSPANTSAWHAWIGIKATRRADIARELREILQARGVDDHGADADSAVGIGLYAEAVPDRGQGRRDAEDLAKAERKAARLRAKLAKVKGNTPGGCFSGDLR